MGAQALLLRRRRQVRRRYFSFLACYEAGVALLYLLYKMGCSSSKATASQGQQKTLLTSAAPRAQAQDEKQVGVVSSPKEAVALVPTTSKEDMVAALRGLAVEDRERLQRLMASVQAEKVQNKPVTI